MADVFISYSRADGAFVHELHTFLTGSGKDVWVDWEDIPPASQWEEDINDSIDAAESFVFVISRNSLTSKYSLDELRHAGERGKRIVPIACDGADPEQAPEGLRQLNWVWCRPDDDRPAAFAKVLDALDTDLAWAEVHTRLLVRAVEWDERRDSSLLLRGRDLEDAQEQLAANAGKEPVPTELQRAFVLASRRTSTRRQRVILASVSLALVVSVSLGLVALLQRNLANERAEIARSQAFAAQAVAALDSAPAAALEEAVDAMETHRTPEARVALRRALLANPVAYAIGSDSEPTAGARLDALSFSDDAQQLVGLTPDDVLHVWRSTTGRPAETARATMFALQGPLLVTGRGRKARVLDLPSGDELHTLRVPPGRRVIGVGVSQGVPRAAIAGRRTIVLEDLSRRHAVSLELRPSRGTRALFSAEGDRVTTFAPDTHAQVWDSVSGRLLARLSVAETAAISPDGRFVATVGYGGAATLWSAAGDRVAHLGPAGGVVFSPDSKVLAAVDHDGAAGVWVTARGRQVAAIPGFGSLEAGLEGATVYSDFSPGAAFSNDGTRVALANADGNVRVWDVAARKQVGTVATGWANALAFAPRGRMLAAMAWDGEVVVARSPTSVPLHTGFPLNSCVPDFDPLLTPDGKHVLARAAGGAGVWAVDGRRVATLRPPARPADARRNVEWAAVSGDGTAVAMATSVSGCFKYPGESHGTAVWRLGQRRPLREMRTTSAAPMLDTDGRLVAVGGEVWRTSGGEPLPGLGEVLLLSPDGTVALVVRAGGFAVVETASGKTVAALRDAGPLREERDSIPEEASFSPDGQRLLMGWGSTARLWDATTGEPIAVLGRTDEEVGAFSFGDGGRLVLATFSDRAAVFSAADGAPISSVAGPFARGDISSNGAFAAAPLTGGAIDVADMATGARVVLQTGTGISLAGVSFGPTADVIVARDAAGDVHVVRCEICASDDELLALARSRLAVLGQIEATRPPFVATG